MKLRVKLLDDGATLPAYAHDGDAGLDLCSAVDVQLKPGERAAIPTGVAVEIPAGCAGFVLARSGRALAEGLALVNAPGLVDAGYRGEIRVIAVNLDPEEPIHVRRGDRIAQLVVQRVERVEVEPVDELEPSERGEGGFGSSGR